MVDLLATLSFILVAVVTTTTAVLWTLQRDDPSEYTHQVLSGISDQVDCVLRAIAAGATAALAVDGSCSLLACRLGDFGCRKCRNLKNSSLPQIWVAKSSSQNFCWRTFQHRVDASVDFNRSWSDYVTGFGQGENANYWMGLEKLHQLTNNSPRRVRWEFSDWNDRWSWTENPNFQVSDGTGNYNVSMDDYDVNRSSISQTPVSSQFSPNGKMFSTFDADNDIFSASCATQYGAGWWFGSCSFFSPNGKYYELPTALYTYDASCRGIFYQTIPYVDADLFYSMKKFECLIEDSL